MFKDSNLDDMMKLNPEAQDLYSTASDIFSFAKRVKTELTPKEVERGLTPEDLQNPDSLVWVINVDLPLSNNVSPKRATLKVQASETGGVRLTMGFVGHKVHGHYFEKSKPKRLIIEPSASLAVLTEELEYLNPYEFGRYLISYIEENMYTENFKVLVYK